jgi:hypothetical protein
MFFFVSFVYFVVGVLASASDPMVSIPVLGATDNGQLTTDSALSVDI